MCFLFWFFFYSEIHLTSFVRNSTEHSFTGNVNTLYMEHIWKRKWMKHLFPYLFLFSKFLSSWSAPIIFIWMSMLKCISHISILSSMNSMYRYRVLYTYIHPCILYKSIRFYWIGLVQKREKIWKIFGMDFFSYSLLCITGAVSVHETFSLITMHVLTLLIFYGDDKRRKCNSIKSCLKWKLAYLVHHKKNFWFLKKQLKRFSSQCNLVMWYNVQKKNSLALGLYWVTSSLIVS